MIAQLVNLLIFIIDLLVSHLHTLLSPEPFIINVADDTICKVIKLCIQSSNAPIKKPTDRRSICINKVNAYLKTDTE